MTAGGKILVTGSGVAAAGLGRLRDAGFEVANPTRRLDEGELRSALAGAVGYLVGGEEFVSEGVLAGADRLRAIALLGVGYESFVDVEAASRRGIPVTNTPGALTVSVAEFAVGQLLNARRRLAEYGEAYRRGAAGTERKQRDLAAGSVGVVGLGAIGSRVAEILRLGFGATVLYASRSRRPELEARLGVEHVTLPELAARCDAMVLTVPANEETRGLIDGPVLDALPPDAVLVNMTRPWVVDAGALGAGLRAGRPAVAAFDGFYEGEPGKALLTAFGNERLLVTGHVAALTHGAWDGMAAMAVRSLLNLLAGGDDEHVVNRTGLRGRLAHGA